MFLTTLGIVYVQEAERQIPMTYASRYQAGALQRQAYLPFKVRAALVVCFGTAWLLSAAAWPCLAGLHQRAVTPPHTHPTPPPPPRPPPPPPHRHTPALHTPPTHLHAYTHLPLQVNATGVMPVIFSTSVLALPSAATRAVPALAPVAAALGPNGSWYLAVRQ